MHASQPLVRMLILGFYTVICCQMVHVIENRPHLKAEALAGIVLKQHNLFIVKSVYPQTLIPVDVVYLFPSCAASNVFFFKCLPLGKLFPGCRKTPLARPLLQLGLAVCLRTTATLIIITWLTFELVKCHSHRGGGVSRFGLCLSVLFTCALWHQSGGNVLWMGWPDCHI